MQTRPAPRWPALRPLVALALLVAAAASAAAQGSGPAGRLEAHGSGGQVWLEWRVSGVEVGEHRFSPANRYWTAPARQTSRRVTFSGTVHVAVGPGMVTNGSAHASLRYVGGEEERYDWAEMIGDGAVHEESFSLTLDVPPGGEIYIEAGAGKMGGVYEGAKFFLAPEGMPVEAPSPEPTEGAAGDADEDGGIPPWAIAVGGLGALLAAAAVIAGLLALAALRGKGKSPSHGYVLQLSADRLRVRLGQPVGLEVTAWRVDASGLHHAAPEAAIRVALPVEAQGWVVDPATGRGSVHCAVGAHHPGATRQVMLTVTAAVTGSCAPATVAVELEPPFRLEMTAQPSPPLPLGDPNGLWVYAAVVPTGDDPGVDLAPFTAAIAFDTVGANAERLVRPREAAPPGWKATQVVAPALPAGASLAAGAPAVRARVQVGQDLLSAELPIPLDPGLELAAEVVNGERRLPTDPLRPTYCVSWCRASRQWALGEVVVYFHAQGSDSPQAPGFDPDWAPLAASPDLLDFDPVASTDGGLTWRFHPRLKPGVALDDAWLLGDGLVTVTLACCRPAAGAAPAQRYGALLGLWLRPPLEVGVSCETERAGWRPYERWDLDLEEGELVADGQDVLGVLLFVRRLDLDDPAHEVEAVTIERPRLEVAGAGSRDFELVEVPEPATPWRARFELRSRRPLLWRAGAARELQLDAAGEVAVRSSIAGGKLVSLPLEGAGRARPLYLLSKLWVVPGQERGVSEAHAFLCLAPRRGATLEPLEGVELELAVESRGSGAAGLEPAAPAAFTDESGRARWKLEYSGLTWDDVRAGRVSFAVRCRVAGADEAALFLVDVGANSARFGAALERDAARLDLANPEFQQSASRLRFLTLHRKQRGPLYNLRAMYTEWRLGRELPLDHPFMRYTCGQVSKRLRDWAFERRFGSSEPETALEMNGLELARGALVVGPSGPRVEPEGTPHFHVFLVFHLSGQDVWEDSQAIDPWWAQQLDDDVVVGWGEQTAQAVSAVMLLVAELAAVALFLKATLYELLGRAVASEPFLAREVAQMMRRWALGAAGPSAAGVAGRLTEYAIAAQIVTSLAFHRALVADRCSDDAHLSLYDPGTTHDPVAALIGRLDRGELPPVDPVVAWGS